MLAPEPVVLEGYGVRLEPLAASHLTDLFAASAYDEIWRWTSTPRPRSVQDLRAGGNPGVGFAVVVAGVAVGSTCYLDVDVPVEGLEVGGTWYRRDLWATSVNPACKLLLLGHAFDALGVQRVTLKTDALNTRSKSAITRLGCSYDGTLRHHRLRGDGSVRDTAYFSLLAGEWPTARLGLRARLGAG